MANLRVDKITSTETFEKTGSVQFDGDGDRLSVADNADFGFGSGDFTIEYWIYHSQTGSRCHPFDLRASGAEDSVTAFYVSNTTELRIYFNGSDKMNLLTELQPSQWVHHALVRNGDILTFYQNGIRLDSAGVGGESLRTSAPAVIGAKRDGSEVLNGHISNFRVIKGQALYTSNFKPPMRELEVVPGTVLLACQSKTDASLEKTGKTITVTGNAVANELTPGLLTPIVKSGGGSAITGSVEFDGTGDYLTIPNTEDLRLADSDFTIELWATISKVDNTYSPFALFENSSALRSYQLEVRSNGAVRFEWWYNGSSANDITTGTGAVIVNEWYHYAVSRNGATIKLFINGIEVGSADAGANAFFNNTVTPFIIGGMFQSGVHQQKWQGNISNFRINKGTALYTDSFIPPTRELKNVPGTVLLCCQDENSVTTEITGKTITSNGDPTPSNFTPQVGDDRQITFEGVTKIDTDAYFYLPTGDTVTRESRSGRGLFGGAMSPSFNDTIDLITIPTMGNSVDFGDIFSGRYTGTCSSSTRAVFGGGEDPSGVTNIMDFVTIATNSDAINFGDLTEDRRQAAGCSSSTRGLFGGGSDPTNLDIIDFITIASTGDATDFGNLTVARRGVMSCSSPVRGVWGGGVAPGPTLDVIDYVTIASTGNALDFGNLTQDRRNIASGACSNQVRGVFGGGRRAPANANSDIIDYITIASTGNALDFGDLSGTKGGVGACSTLIRGVFAGGYTPTILNNLEYITIASTGNAKDFGDLTIAAHSRAGCSDSHGGLG